MDNVGRGSTDVYSDAARADARRRSGQFSGAASPQARRKSSEIVRRFLRRLDNNPTGVGFGFLAFVFVSSVFCVLKVGSEEASNLYAQQVGQISWPMSGHAACLVLAFKGYYFQTSSLKRRFLILTLYSSSVAAASYWVMEKAAVYRLVTTDAFGQPFVFYRVFQWIHTTPAMLQSIASLADLANNEIVQLHGLNMTMLITGLLSHLVQSVPAAILLQLVCWVAFVWEMMRVHVSFLRVEDRATLLLHIREQSFSGAMRDPRAPNAAHEIDAFRQSAQTTLRMIRHLHYLTLALWTAFGLNDTLIIMGMLPVYYAEHAWALLDILAKVLFSSMLSMTAVVSLDEAEKQNAWLNEEKARDAIRGSDDVVGEASSRTETLSKLCQEGWGLVVQTFMQRGLVPVVTLREEGPEVDLDGVPAGYAGGYAGSPLGEGLPEGLKQRVAAGGGGSGAGAGVDSVSGLAEGAAGVAQSTFRSKSSGS